MSKNMRNRFLIVAVVMALGISIAAGGAINAAYAALSFTNNKRQDQKHTGKFKIGTIDITMDSAAPPWTIAASDLSLTGLIALFPAAVAQGGYVVTYDQATTSLWVYEGDNDAGSDGPLTPCDAWDMNGVKVRAHYWGY